MKRYEETIATRYFKLNTNRLTSVVCDICGKKIESGNRYSDELAAYIRVHTWHNDWGNDSCESDERYDLCKECAAKFVSDYIMDADGSEELELSVEHATIHETDETPFIPISKEDVK